MNKKNMFILAISCIILPCKLHPSIKEIESFQSETQKNAYKELLKLKELYDELTQLYDKEIIDQHESNIKLKLTQYITKNLNNPLHIHDTKAIEKATQNLLNHLSTLSHSIDAYATTSMIFILNWTELISKSISQATTQPAKAILKDTNREIKILINRIFLEPMTQSIQEVEKQHRNT